MKIDRRMLRFARSIAAPQRMSCSETSTRSSPKARSASSRITTPATIVGARSGCRPVTSRRSASGMRGEAREQQLEIAELEHVALDAVGVVGVELLGDRRAARWRCRRRRSAAATVARTSARDGAVDDRRAPRRRARAARPARAGRSAGGARSGARRRPGWRRGSATSPPRPIDELGRAAADVDHEQRPSGGSARPAVAPRKVSRASSSPGIVRASRPKRSRTSSVNSRAVRGVAHRAGQHAGGARRSRVRRIASW